MIVRHLKFLQILIFFKLFNFIANEVLIQLDSKLIIENTYKKCNKSEIVCLGIEPELNFSEIDCIQNRNCLALILIYHSIELKEFNIYLITNQPNADQMQFNIYYGNFSNQMSIELNCTDFKQHKPTSLMNINNYRLKFNLIPNILISRELLNLNDDHHYRVWSVEENFFVNDIFKNEANYLYFDLLKRNYDIKFNLRLKNKSRKLSNYYELTRSSFKFTKKSKSNFYSITNLILSLNVIILISLLIAIFIHYILLKPY